MQGYVQTIFTLLIAELLFETFFYLVRGLRKE